MINYIWCGMILISFVCGLWNQCLPDVAAAVTDGVKASVDMLIGLCGIIVFWTGVLKIAEHTDLIDIMGRFLYKPLHYFFPEVPQGHPAMGEIVLVTIAAALGLNNAAIPFGMRAMEQLDTLNPRKGEATNAMCMLVTINASNIQLLPISTVAFLALYGADHPTHLLMPATIASLCSTIVGASAVSIAKRFYPEDKIVQHAHGMLDAQQGGGDD